MKCRRVSDGSDRISGDSRVSSTSSHWDNAANSTIAAQDARPDIVTMAKGIGNGFPLGAVVTTEEVGNHRILCLFGFFKSHQVLLKIAASFGKALYFNTYGGNPLASVVGKTVLEVGSKVFTNSLVPDNSWLGAPSKPMLQPKGETIKQTSSTHCVSPSKEEETRKIIETLYGKRKSKAI